MIARILQIAVFAFLTAGCAAAAPAGNGAEPTAEAADASVTAEEDSTEFVVLTTTDMHGKCWHTNLLTEKPEPNNMLRVSTAVQKIREEYGEENVLLIDNGDTFQGTPVSQIQLLNYAKGTSEDPLAMAVCLKEIGYDAFVLGNHEFNFDWNTMSDAYRYLEENGVPVLAANACYDGSSPEHGAGENAFTPYIIKTVTVNGHEHRIGVLGLENTDITRWDLPVNYPGLQFVHPGNESWRIQAEAELFLPKMKEEGCEFIIASYHSGLGDTEGDVTFGISSENQGLRLIRETDSIDMLILGHDHSSGYSNTLEKDRSGKDVLIVNGGGQELTKSVFRFTEGANGRLRYELADSRNLDLKEYDIDPALEALMQPYAETAEEEVDRPLGSVSGKWDESTDYYLSQTDTLDLVSAAMIEIPAKRMAAEGIDPAAAGIDHRDVDMTMTSVTVSGSYVIKPGDLSIKDVYKLCRYANNIVVLPMTGRQIRDVMEENAAKRLTVRVMDGQAYFYTRNDNFTNLIFGGLNFTYDMAQPEGERVRIEGFANGRAFEEDTKYLVAVNNYILGNEHCGLRDYHAEDAVWSQLDGVSGETIQDIIAEYIREKCGKEGTLTADDFDWHWSITYSKDPAALPPYQGRTSAEQEDIPEKGEEYVLYHEAQGLVMTDAISNGGFSGEKVEAYGDHLTGPVPENALRFTFGTAKSGNILLRDRQGRYLTCGKTGGLSLEEKEAEDGRSEWKLEEAYGGFYVVNAEDTGRAVPQAMEYYGGKFTTYPLTSESVYVFNFYDEEQAGTDGGKAE